MQVVKLASLQFSDGYTVRGQINYHESVGTQWFDYGILNIPIISDKDPF